MGLVKRAGGAQIPPGEKLRFRIGKAVEDEGDHGPQVKFSLKVLGGNYHGVELFEWAKVAVDEETEDEYVADGGKLYNIAIAAFDGDVDTIDSFDSIGDLAEALEGKSFVSITKFRGKNDAYIGVTWDMIYTDPEAQNEAEIEEVPF
jgi:hypothetical protein